MPLPMVDPSARASSPEAEPALKTHRRFDRAARLFTEPGLHRLIRESYRLLDLITFFTIAGGKESRAWTLRRGQSAWEAAGKVHTDIQRGFIRAEVVQQGLLIAAGGLAGARAQGAVRLEGKEYVVQDGDVLTFRFNV